MGFWHIYFGIYGASSPTGEIVVFVLAIDQASPHTANIKRSHANVLGIERLMDQSLGINQLESIDLNIKRSQEYTLER